MRKILLTGLLAIGLVLATALPSYAAWSQQTNSGSPGAVVGVDWRGAEAGVCGDPYASVSCNSGYNEMFVNRYRAYTAPYAVAQNINSVSTLHWYNSSTGKWVAWLNNNQGTCSNLAGGGAGSCRFGSPASDLYNPRQCPCTPAFINLPRGYSYTVTIKVTWLNAATGGTLASATYRPHGTSSDIGCAGYATQIGRCSGPYAFSSVLGYVWMP